MSHGMATRVKKTHGSITIRHFSGALPLNPDIGEKGGMRIVIETILAVHGPMV